MRGSILLIALIGLAGVLVRAQDKSRRAPAQPVEVVKTGWPSVKSAQAAIPVAISTMLGRIRLDQPLFVQSVRESDDSVSVRAFKMSASEFGRTLDANTEAARKLVETRVTGRGVETTFTQDFQSLQATPAEQALLRAIVYLQAIGGLPDQFRIWSRPEANDEFHVEVVRFPLKPGAYTMVIVSKTGIRLQPGM